MIAESLILGSIIYLLKKIYRSAYESAPGRAFSRLCAALASEWDRSAVVNWFCTPGFLGKKAGKSAGRARRSLCSAYERLGMSRAVSGSMFLNCFIWAGLAAVLAPLIPTMGVLALCMVAYGSVLLRLLHDRSYGYERSPLSLPVNVYAAFYLIGTLHSVDRSGSLYIGVLSIVFILFSTVLYYSVDRQRQLDLLTALMVTAAAAVSCYGILQYKFRWGYQSAAWIDDDMFSSIRFRVSATLQNPNMLGQYLLLMIPLGGAKLLGSKGTLKKLYYFCCCAAMCLCMLLTFSRGAWLGLMFAGVIFFVLLRPRLLFMAPFALIALYMMLPETIAQRFTSIGDLTDSSTSYRLNIWLGTIRMLRDGYWKLGIGPGVDAFNKIYPYYSYETVVAPHAHNLFLQIVCDAGIAALIVFLWILLRLYRTLCAALRIEKDFMSKLLQIACLSGMSGFLVQAMTDYSFYNYRVMFIFWAYAGLGALCARRSSMKRGGSLL